jgi:glycosyltransferase involved in cell wall biosynthesis
VADFRDEWVENPNMVYPTRAYRQLHFFLEKKIAENADRLIAPAPEFCRLLKKHPGCAPCETIYMGFDPQDYPAGSAAVRQKDPSGRFTLVFSGLFYGSFRPDRLLKAINSLIDRGVIPRESIRTIFVGANSPADLREKDRYGVCEFSGFVAHQTALRYIYSADALLLLLSDERGKNVVPSKTFEYLASGKPILALIPPDGDAAGIIRRTKTGVVADFNDDKAIETAFLELYRQWQGMGEPFRPDAEALAEYNQRRITRRFAALLNEMIGDK